MQRQLIHRYLKPNLKTHSKPTLRASFETSSNDEDREPWERYSAATGMAVFDEESDVSMDDVFKRADTLMYQNKLESKMGRE